MSAFTVTRYELRVARYQDSRPGSKLPNLRVEVALEDLVQKTEIVKKSRSPAWNDEFVFLSSDPPTSTTFHIRIKERKPWKLQSDLAGCVDITISNLLETCACGEAQLDVLSPPENGRQSPVGVIDIYLKDANAEKSANIDIEAAREDMKRIKGSANVSESAYVQILSLVQKTDTVVEAIDEIVKIHPYLNLTWLAVSALYKVVSHQFRQDEKLIELVELMEEGFQFARDAKALSDKTGRIKEGFKNALQLTTKCCEFVHEYTSHNFADRAWRVNASRIVSDYSKAFRDLKKQIDDGVALHVASRVDNIDARQQLQVLKELLDPDKSDTYSRSRCLPGTRKEYLDRIKSWLFSEDTRQNILWITGIAGAGKSTIAASIMDDCDKKGCLASFLFFQRGKDEHKSIIRSIAYQLAAFSPVIAERIITAAGRFKNITGSLAAQQFEELLLEPLRTGGIVTGQVIIILDALDECGSAKQRREILELLRTKFSELPVGLRFLVTSRPENDIMNSLSARQHILEIKLDHASEDTRRDVDAYIDDEMRKIFTHWSDGWSWNETMKVLHDGADGLFIWAATAVKMVQDTDNPRRKLQSLVDRSVGMRGIDSLYETMLKESGISWEDDESKERFTRVLGVIVFAKEALTDRGIENLLGLEAETIELTLGRLRSVLSYEADQPVRLHHASFPDYLTSPERSGGKPWHIDELSQKRAIAERCFDVMRSGLRFNICDLETSFVRNDEVQGLQERIKDEIPPHLDYACRFWAVHVCELQPGTDMPGLTEKLGTFVKHHLLYWLEVLSLTKHFNRVAGRALFEASQWSTSVDEGTSSSLWSAYRLASTFAHPISQSTPHIYLSALSLWKGESRVMDGYSLSHPVASVDFNGNKARNPCIGVFKGHTDWVTSVAFSPDGKRIVSGSHDGTIRVWDSDTGDVVSGPFEGHTGPVNSVAFSPDGKRVASGSHDETIRVWDSDTGEVVSGPFEGHTDSVSSVAFSPDGKRVASGSYDNTIRVWDSDTGEVVSGPFEGHTNWVSSVAFSPDGKRVASGSYDNTIRVWDSDSSELVSGPFEGHTGWVISVVFSPDGRRVASGSWDKTIRVWDSDSSELVSGPFEGHTSSVSSVAFSPDGKRVASGSGDNTIRVWDSDSGDLVSDPFEGHTGSVYSVSFSPDGKRVASGSWDKTIRVWDSDSGELVSGPFEGHTSSVNSVAFSPDGKRVASGSGDNTIRVWDSDSGDLASGPFEGHTDSAFSVAFSPDGKRVASGSGDNTIRVWDSDSGDLVSGPFEGHTNWVTSVGFSPDGKRVASGSLDKTIRVWDSDSGDLISGPFEGHTSSVWSVAFSPDGKRVASGSLDKTIRVWDSDSGDLISGPFEGHTDRVRSVAFSPDGKRVASGSDDNTIRVWGSDSGDLASGPFEGHTGPVSSVSFSPDGKRVASGSLDTTIRVWDSDSGDLASGPSEGHTGPVSSVSFSPDGKRIASGSLDKTIRVWDSDSGDLVSGSFEGHTDGVRSVVFTPDGKHFVSGSDDHTIRIWDPCNGRITGSPSENPSSPRYTLSSNWTMSEDGWVLGEQRELLIWIPEDMRKTLLRPQNTALFSVPYVTKLDFTRGLLGEGWCKGFPNVDDFIQ